MNGRVQQAQGVRTFESINPSNGEVFAQLADGSLTDMQQAIQCARNAFDNGPWATMSFAERGIYLKRIAKLIRENAKELAQLESLDIGKTSKQSTFIDVPTAAETFEYFSATTVDAHDNPVNEPVKSRTVYEPMGVVGCIIPWNYPLIMFAWKVAPALIAGNTVVFKPSRLGSVSIVRLAQLVATVGLPEGVLNIVTTADNSVAEELAKNSMVDMLSFTGGTKTGQRLMKLAAETTKKISLELGGKSPNIVFADCDMNAALGGTLSAIFMNQGQMCTAGSRLLIEESIHDQFLAKLIERAKSLKTGDALNPATEFGPVISQSHREELLRAVEQAKQQGAKVLYGGKAVEGQGFYMEPTVLGNVTNSMAIAQEEVFGPILSVIKFKTEEEAINTANDSKYGLAACVWTKDKARSERVSRKLQAGIVWVNTYGGFYNEATFGGYKQSGFGRELGLHGVLEYMQSKHVCVDQTPGGMPLAASWF